jgi:quercetin dioxygenase-like cupin family protein
VAAACRASFDRIPWGLNPVAARMSGVGDILLVAPMMGPDGPLQSDLFRMGLYYQRPDTYYPLHNHAAAETYFLIAGDAIWQAGEDIRHRSAGEVIHHPPYLPHAFRAGPMGLLALWRWSGDISSDTYRLLPDAAAR